jgi:hypothetical protein
VTRQLISPQEYETLLKVLKERIRSAQLQALRSVNSELISLYADIRRMIVEKQQGLDLNKSLPTKPPARMRSGRNWRPCRASSSEAIECFAIRCTGWPATSMICGE